MVGGGKRSGGWIFRTLKARPVRKSLRNNVRTVRRHGRKV